MKEIALGVAGVIFVIVAALHLLRFFFKVEVRMGRVSMPLWVSILGFLISGSLAVWFLSLISK